MNIIVKQDKPIPIIIISTLFLPQFANRCSCSVIIIYVIAVVNIIIVSIIAVSIIIIVRGAMMMTVIIVSIFILAFIATG